MRQKLITATRDAEVSLSLFLLCTECGVKTGPRAARTEFREHVETVQSLGGSAALLTLVKAVYMKKEEYQTLKSLREILVNICCRFRPQTSPAVVEELLSIKPFSEDFQAHDTSCSHRLFGRLTQSAEPTGRLFGQSTTNTNSTGGLLGQTTTNTKPTGSLFAQSTTNTKSTGGLFGQSTPSPNCTGGLFGSHGSASSSPAPLSGQGDRNISPSSTSLFGSPTIDRTKPSYTEFRPSSTTSGLFGNGIHDGSSTSSTGSSKAGGANSNKPASTQSGTGGGPFGKLKSTANTPSAAIGPEQSDMKASSKPSVAHGTNPSNSDILSAAFIAADRHRPKIPVKEAHEPEATGSADNAPPRTSPPTKDCDFLTYPSLSEIMVHVAELDQLTLLKSATCIQHLPEGMTYDYANKLTAALIKKTVNFNVRFDITEDKDGRLVLPWLTEKERIELEDRYLLMAGRSYKPRFSRGVKFQERMK